MRVAYDQKWLALRQTQQSPTSEQYIRAIALAAPTICGGGVFGYAGRTGDLGTSAAGVTGFAGVIVEADTRSGVNRGALFEGGGYIGAYNGGAGTIISNNGGGLGSADLAYGGIGGHIGNAHIGTGLVGFSSGVGAYGEVAARGREFGGGVYLNITTNAGCLAKQ